jgi:hypothetical protein
VDQFTIEITTAAGAGGKDAIGEGLGVRDRQIADA